VPNVSGGDAESIRSFNASVEVGDDASIHSTSAPPQNTASTSSETGMGRKRRAVWAMKFSNDGRYLAVGGKDGVVRGTYYL
jgi:WD40 repeat protein